MCFHCDAGLILFKISDVLTCPPIFGSSTSGELALLNLPTTLDYLAKKIRLRVSGSECLVQTGEVAREIWTGC
jgi:hypothetical protein